MKDKKKLSTAVQLNKKIRRSWDINPVTKIKENEMRDNKKRRRNDKDEIKRYCTDEFS